MIIVDTSVWVDYFIRKTADVIIATFCIEKQIPLLFSDRDFLPFTQYLNLTSACTKNNIY
jgi:predicted nucleic acid-binding protein